MAAKYGVGDVVWAIPLFSNKARAAVITTVSGDSYSLAFEDGNRQAWFEDYELTLHLKCAILITEIDCEEDEI